MTHIQECLAKNLKRYRKLRQLTQEQLSEKAGTSTNYIGTIEIGKRFPSPQMIEKLAEALGISSPELFISQNKPKSAANPFNDMKTELKKSIIEHLHLAVDEVFGE